MRTSSAASTTCSAASASSTAAVWVARLYSHQPGLPDRFRAEVSLDLLDGSALVQGRVGRIDDKNRRGTRS